MRRALRNAIPSMFHRRLLLLAGGAAVVAAVMGAQAVRLTLGGSQAKRIAKAERALRATELVPTVRGNILDRKGRVLATDQPGWAVAVNYSVIAGDWAYTHARARAYRQNRHRWSELSPAQRETLVERYEGPYDQQVEALWSTLADLGHESRARLEKRKATITRRVQNTASHLWVHWRQKRAQELGEPVDLASVARPIAEQEQAHAVLERVSDATRRQVQNFIAEARSDSKDADAVAVWKQVKLLRPKHRRYPYETMTVSVDRSYLPSPIRQPSRLNVKVRGVAMHILGIMRDAWAKDEHRRPFHPKTDLGGYLPGDRVGSFGIEASQEDRLRGTRGRVIKRLDTGHRDTTAPLPGKTVRLSIDIDLQAYVQAVMSPQIGLMQVQPWQGLPKNIKGRLGQPLNGAAVVLDIPSSDVLAAVSIPPMPLDQLRNDPDAIYHDPANMPSLNRFVGRNYQPGSIVKPLILNAVVSEGLLHKGEIVHCPGYLWPGSPKVFRDWMYKEVGVPFGDITGVTAIERSSNVFFGKMSQRLGPRREWDWYHKFGVDRALNCGLPGAVAGNLPPRDKLSRTDAAFMAIGQGRIGWTPLHVAAAYAAIARGGLYRTPSFLDNPRPKTRPHDLRLSPTGVQMAMQGLYESANNRQGTTHSLVLLDHEPTFNTPGVVVRSKSGTAQAAPLREPIDDDGDGFPDRYGKVLKRGNHAWVAALVQPPDASKPRYVVVVIVEYAGSGGAVAGPVVNAIIHAMADLGLPGFKHPAGSPQAPPANKPDPTPVVAGASAGGSA